MVSLRFCFYDFVSSLDELDMKHRMVSQVNCCDFSDISIMVSQPLKPNEKKIRFEIPKLYTAKHWTSRRETIMWTNFGESLVLIAQLHRKSFPLYTIIISQILKQYEMFTDSQTLCVFFNPWTHLDKIVDIDIPRYFPINNPFLSYSHINRDRFEKVFGCVFGRDSSFISHSLQHLMSSRRNVFEPSSKVTSRLYQRALVLSKQVQLAHYDPIMEEIIEFMYDKCCECNPLSFVVGSSANHMPLMEKNPFNLLVDLEAPVLGFGDTNNSKFRNRMATILKLLENEDDFNYYFSSKRRKCEETVLDITDFYNLAQISQFIETPSRLQIPNFKNLQEKYVEANQKIKTELDNNERFGNISLINNRKKIGEKVKKLRITIFSSDPEVIKHTLKKSICENYRHDHLIGLGTHYAISILEVTNRSKLDNFIYKVRTFFKC